VKILVRVVAAESCASDGETNDAHSQSRTRMPEIMSREVCHGSSSYFRISPVFMDQSNRSSSSKLILDSFAKRRISFSVCRYRPPVVGGFGESITPSSYRQRTMCLSRMAYPVNPMLRKKWLASLYPNPFTRGSFASQSRRSIGSRKLTNRSRKRMENDSRR